MRHDAIKRIDIIRFGSSKKVKAANGDLYDSTLRLRSPDDKSIMLAPNINTDASKRYRGQSGILAEGSYSGICINSPKHGKCIEIFNEQYYDLVHKREDITVEYATLPSLIPNPNQGDKKIMQWILIHQGGSEWDWSQGCITVPKTYLDRLLSYLAINEKVDITLIRNLDAEVPYWYNVVE